LISALNLWFSH